MSRLCDGSWLKSYLKHTAWQEGPEAYHLWTGISMLAGALRENAYFKLGTFKINPSLYVMLCGPTGIRKSSSANLGMPILRKIDAVRILQDQVTPERLIQFIGEDKVKKFTKNPKIIEFEHSAFLFAPEFTSLVGSVSYAASLCEKLTRIYDGSRLEYRTKTGGDSVIENVNLNFLGCSTPEWLSRGLGEDSFAGGFMARILFIVRTQTERKKKAFHKLTKEDKQREEYLVHDLQQVSRLQGIFDITDEAVKTYEEWYLDYEPDYTNSRMAGYYQRKQTFILKVAMCLSASDGDSLIIEEKHIKVAMKLLDQVESFMEDAWAFIGATNEARIAQTILQILTEAGGAISKRRLVDKVKHLIRNMREFQDIIFTLQEAGRIKQIQTKKGKIAYIFTDMQKKFIAKKKKQQSKLVVKEKQT